MSQTRDFYDFRIRRFHGEKVIFTPCAVTDADGAAVDLTGFDIEVMGKLSLDDLDADAVFFKTVSDGVTLLDQTDDATKGQFTVTIPGSDFEDVPSTYTSKIFVDIQINPSGDGPFVGASGILEIVRAGNQNTD